MRFWKPIVVIIIATLTIASEATAQPNGPARAKIVGGEDALFSEIPWQAAIVQRDPTTGQPKTRISCGATFVRPNILMTAAHCVVGGPISDSAGKVVDYWQFAGNLSSWAVLNGSARLDDPGMKVYGITGAIMHPRYAELGTDYDFALLRVKESYGGTLVDILTPSENESLNVGDTAQVSGWGRTAEHGNTTPDLQKLDVKIIARSVCDGSESYDGRITKRMLCWQGIRRAGLVFRRQRRSAYGLNWWCPPSYRDRQLGGRMRAAQQIRSLQPYHLRP